MKKLSRSIWKEVLTRRLALWAVIPAGIALFLMMVGITAHIIGRKIGHPVPGVFSSSEEFMILVLFLPMAYVAATRGHVYFEILSRRWSSRVNAAFDALAAILGSVLFGGLTVGSWKVAWGMFIIREYRQEVIDFPVWPFRIILAIGFGLFTFQLVVIAIQELHKAFGKNNAEISRQDQSN